MPASGDLLPETITGRIRDEILDGRLEAGERVTLRPTAARLGVSINVIGTALRSLANEGWLEFEPRVGARVIDRSFEVIRSEFILRLALETEAARRCSEALDPPRLRHLADLAKRADDEHGSHAPTAVASDTQFHLAVARSSGSRALEDELAKLLPRLIVPAPRETPPALYPGQRHFELIAAFREGPDSASTAIRAHLAESLELMLPHLSL